MFYKSFTLYRNVQKNIKVYKSYYICHMYILFPNPKSNVRRKHFFFFFWSVRFISFFARGDQHELVCIQVWVPTVHRTHTHTHVHLPLLLTGGESGLSAFINTCDIRIMFTLHQNSLLSLDLMNNTWHFSLSLFDWLNEWIYGWLMNRLV